MTMRLDIVTNDAGELVRREHARELGAGVVVSIYRLAKLAQLHDLGNQAFLRQLEQTHQLIGEYCLRSGGSVNILFAHRATFVAGQLLKGNRGAYDAAAELGALLEKIGGSELHIARDVTREDCLALAEQISTFHRTGNASQLRLPPKITLRRVADAARLRGIELEDLTPDQRIVRAYASAVVIMRRFFEDLSASRYILPRRIKRIAQSLVDLSDASTASFLGVTEARNANHDEAGRAVNTAILAVAIARELATDRSVLSQIAMAAMMQDVARPRALALAGAAGGPMPGMAGPTTLSEDQEDRLPAGAAAVLTALGRVNEPSITRTVLAFEALWLRRRTWLGPVYWGARPPTLHAAIIAVARRYNDLLTPEPGLAPPTTDYAVATLASELTEPQDRTVLRMLVSALGLLPTGTVVQLSTGEIAEVVRGARGLGDKPRVRLVADANGAAPAQAVEIELAADARRAIHRVIAVDGWRKGLEQAPGAAIEPPPDSDAHVAAPAPAPGPRPAARDERPGAGGELPSSASMPSFGSTPSAVAEAMGHVIRESAAPRALPREAERPDRTVFQPPGEGELLPLAPSRLEPTARGTLATTPLPHVLVYMLDHRLTGTVVFEGTNSAPDGSDDTIYFVAGVPAKIRLAERVALLGEVLVEEGVLARGALDDAVGGAQRLGLLLGEYLVGHGLIAREALSWALESQLLQKIVNLANLAPELEYSFYRDVDLLDGWGGEIVLSHPLSAVLASVRHWNDRARVRATLSRIGKHPLAIHPDADLSTVAVLPEEQAVLEAITSAPLPVAELLQRRLADEEVVASLVYALAVTRQFAFKGQKKGPMAPRARHESAAPAAAAPLPAPSSAVGPPASQHRAKAAAPPSARPAASRPPGPAIRPTATGPSRTGPQVRPATKRERTMIGIAPPDRHPPPASPPVDPESEEGSGPSSVSEQKTTVRASPQLGPRARTPFGGESGEG